MEDCSSSEPEEEETLYLLHDAAEAGDCDGVRSLLGGEEGQAALRVRDVDACAPFHLCLLHGHLEIMQMLLEHKTSLAWMSCEKASPLHIAASLCALPARRQQGLEAAKLLLSANASVFDTDESERLPLHWAAASGHAHLVSLLLEATKTQKEAIEAASEEADVMLLKLVGTPVFEIKDRHGNTITHMAARSNDTSVLKVLLEAAPSESLSVEDLKKQLPIHVAVKGNYTGAARLLAEAAPDTLTVKDFRGLTPAELAQRCGHQELARALEEGDFDGMAEQKESKQTTILAPPDCHKHITGPFPVVRGGKEPPPENVNRLHVLTDSDLGILHGAEFQGLQWDINSQRAALGDVLRVHEWSYVDLLQKASASCTGESKFGALDSDTIISAGSFRAALAAAGAVTAAVDKVMAKQARNAFCAVRPPGHHAGPTGIAECNKQPHGSHGFCLLNNLAIGAAYALSQYRKQGIKKVALLDFDVHHGNGTQACIRNTAPGLATHTFETPYSKGVQEFPVWKPWLDITDAENIFFASVQGVGKSPSGALYPGSGETADNKLGQASDAENQAPFSDDKESGAPLGADAQQSAAQQIVEDPESEFAGESKYEAGMPRIINVGIKGPGLASMMWRRAWRNKIIPALARFEPDIIFISAGFDAHRRDHLNHNYIGLHEHDYEWVTNNIMQVANRCCDGRVVSALEGGYRIQGKIISAFSRSVAAHVRALCEPSFQVWEPEEGRAEQDHERELKMARKKAALEAEARCKAERLEEEQDAQRREERRIEGERFERELKAAVPAVPQQAMFQPKRKRPRPFVDYASLEEEMKAEAAIKQQELEEERKARAKAQPGKNF